MSRLPSPGGDNDVWGDILNDFLSVEHNADGSLKVRSDGTISSKATDSQVVHNTGNETVAGTKTFTSSPVVPTPTLGSQAATKAYVDSAASSGAPDATTSNKGIVQLAGDLGGTATAPTVPGLAAKAPTASPTFTGNVTVPTPTSATDAATKGYVDSTVTSGGTPDADATTKGKVQLAGDLSGTAAAPTVPALSSKAPLASPTFTGTVTVPTPTNPTDATTKAYVDSAAASGTPDATSSTKGKLQLTGDLGGTAASPTVPGLAGKEPSITAGTTSQYWRGDKSFQTLDKSAVGLANVDNTSDVNKPVSTAQQTALNAKAPLASPTFTGTVTVPAPANPTDASTKAYVDSTVAGGSTPDADATTKGKIQLAGDLSGTAASPTVPGLAGKEPTITAGTTSQYYRGDKTFQTLDKSAVGLANVDNTSDVNKPVSTAQAAADALKTDKSTLTTKGDIYVATAASTPARLGVGIDGQALIADSTQTSGVKWASPSDPNSLQKANNLSDVTSIDVARQNISAAKSTTSSGLPSFAGRSAGDIHFDTSTSKEYVLTGVAAASVSDSFDRADGALGTTSSGTTYDTTSVGVGQLTIVSNRAVNAASGGTRYGKFVVGSTATGGSIQATLHLGTPDDITSFSLILGANAAGSTFDWYAQITPANSFQGASVSLHTPDGQFSSIALGNSSNLIANETATYLLDVSSDGKTGRVYKNGTLIGSLTSTTAGTQTQSGISIATRNSVTAPTTTYIDNLSVSLTGTLAWTQTGLPASTSIVQSTTGLGVPTTTGRNAGDLHYDRVGGREYTLVADSSGATAWYGTSGAVNTVAAALPAFTGRVAGDHAFDSTAGKDYVLTGAPGTTFTDAFGGANGALTTTETGSLTYTGLTGVPLASRTSNAVAFGTSMTGAIVNIGSGGAQEVSLDMVFPASGASDEVHLLLRQNSTGTNGYDLSLENGRIKIGRGGPLGSALLATINSGQRSVSGRYTFNVDSSATSPTVRAYLNGNLLGSFTDSSSPQTGSYVGFSGISTVASTVTVDNVNGFSGGTLAWTVSQPPASGFATSTTGFGIPTTTGRAEGDIHFERAGQREYTLVTGVWTPTSGAVNSVASGLPGFTGRAPGDHAFDTTAGKDYVLTGTAGTVISDSFTRANSATSLGSTEVGGKTWVQNNTAAQLGVISNQLYLSGSSGDYAVFDAGATGNSTLSADVKCGSSDGIIARQSSGSTTTGYELQFDSTTYYIYRNNVSLSQAAHNQTISVGAMATLTIETNETTGTVKFFLNGALLYTYSESSFPSGTFFGVHLKTQNTSRADNVYYQGLGTLAWTVSQPAASGFAVSTTGFGLPTTTGRNSGDLHYDRLSQREYVLSSGSWLASGGAVNTVGTGLTPFIGRIAGDHHFDTTAGKDYVLTGAIGTQIADDFNRADTASGLGTSSTGFVWSGTGVNSRISSNKAWFPTSGGGALQDFENIGAGDQSISTTSMTGYAAGLVVCAANSPGTTGSTGYAVDIGFAVGGSLIGLRRSGTTIGSFNMTSIGKTSSSNFAITLSATAAGQVSVYIDGVLRISYTDPSPLTGAYAGFGNFTSNNSAPLFDDIQMVSGGTLAWTLSQPAHENLNEVTTAGSAQTIPDPDTGASISRLTLTAANCTLTFPTPVGGKSFTLTLVQDATGSRTVTWPGTVIWPGGVVPTLTTTASKGDIFSFMCDSATTGLWIGFVAGQNY